jgi:hypothetical protein
MLAFEPDIAAQLVMMGMAMQDATMGAAQVLEYRRGGPGETLMNFFMHEVAADAARKVLNLAAPDQQIPEQETEDERSSRILSYLQDRYHADQITEAALDGLTIEWAAKSLKTPRGWHILREIIDDSVLIRIRERQEKRSRERTWIERSATQREETATQREEMRKLVGYLIDNSTAGLSTSSLTVVQEAMDILQGNSSRQPEDDGQRNVFPMSGITRPKAFRQ